MGHLKKDCPESKDKKDDGMFLGMLECLEVKQEEAEADDHFAALLDCSVFLESNEGQAEFCAGAVGRINGWYEPSDSVDEEESIPELWDGQHDDSSSEGEEIKDH